MMQVIMIHVSIMLTMTILNLDISTMTPVSMIGQILKQIFISPIYIQSQKCFHIHLTMIIETKLKEIKSN